ncbi:MAG TPA: LytTR family DNA-binding domain-containing protein [Saprospiraceae bacterium]|nr:LytTR family DNA-binding domain-containing protein [Saprospiraceae bacterium]
MKLKCLIVDDEPIARKIIEEFISDIDFLELTGIAENPLKAASLMNINEIDLVFMDIQMPKMNGIAFLKSFKNLPLVIMTTAYTEYALESFELDVLDYLVKPIGFERFLKAVNKAHEFYILKSKKKTTSTQDFFFLKTGQKIEKVILKDVLYIEGLSNYVIVHTITKKYVSYLTSKSVEEQLPGNDFIRIHKSYLVAVKSIALLEGNEVKLINDVKLPISRHYKEEVMKMIGKMLFKR